MWDDFGWKIEELVFISVVVSSIMLKLLVSVRRIKLQRVKYMFIGSDYGIECLLVMQLIIGWNSDEVSWKVRVIMLICMKVRENFVCSSGQIVRISDWIILLSKWDRLIVFKMLNEVCVFCGGVVGLDKG